MFFAMLAVALTVPIALPTPAELEVPTLRVVLAEAVPQEAPKLPAVPVVCALPAALSVLSLMMATPVLLLALVLLVLQVLREPLVANMRQ